MSIRAPHKVQLHCIKLSWTENLLWPFVVEHVNIQIQPKTIAVQAAIVWYDNHCSGLHCWRYALHFRAFHCNQNNGHAWYFRNCPCPSTATVASLIQSFPCLLNLAQFMSLTFLWLAHMILPKLFYRPFSYEFQPCWVNIKHVLFFQSWVNNQLGFHPLLPSWVLVFIWDQSFSFISIPIVEPCETP